MAAFNKRRMLPSEKMNVDDNSGDSSLEEDDNDDSNESEEMINQEIQVEFEARAPVDSDFDGIKRLLYQLFLKAHIDLSELANLILHQNYIGSVIKQSEFPEESDDDDSDDAVFGLITVLNISEKKDVGCIKQLKEYILSNCKMAGNQVLYQKFKDILTDEVNDTGFIICERFLNLPPTIAVPMYESLRKEIQTAIHKKIKLDVKNYILISKLYKTDNLTNGKRNVTAPSTVYSNPEEELILEEAEVQFEFSVQGESDSVLSEKWDSDKGIEMRPFRKILLIPSKNFDNIISKIKSNY